VNARRKKEDEETAEKDSSNSCGWHECAHASCDDFLCKGVCWQMCSAELGPVASRMTVA
jgi:hypothetical protein